MQSTQNELRAGRVLTITADAASSGSVRRLAPSGSSTQYAAKTIASSSTTIVGPFTNDRNYEILSETGLLTFAITEPDEVAPLVDSQNVVFGTLATIPAGREYTIAAGAQALMFGPVTVIGDLVLAGEMKIIV
jgi:hypothetical protein